MDRLAELNVHPGGRGQHSAASACYYLVCERREARLISIRKEIDDSANLEARFRALLKAFTSVAGALPKTALPANAELAEQCRRSLEQASASLKNDPAVPTIEEAAAAAVHQIEEICRSNKTAIEERDAALKEVAETVAWAVNSFKGHGERHKTNLTRLADGFEALSKLDDVSELRRRLRDNVSGLRQTVEEMRRENEESVRRLETQVASFQQRVEAARKETGIDRLTGLGSRRDAERHLQRVQKREGSVCIVLYDIEGFRQINQIHGALFGDKLLQALAHQLRERYPGDGCLFRWGADEFLAIGEGSLAARLDQARGICEFFAASSYYSTEGGLKKPVRARVACGAAQYARGESTEEWYRSARESLEQSRRAQHP